MLSSSRQRSKERREEEHTDDMTTRLQLQQFMDEWYYRVLHSGMANETDREMAAIHAMNIFQVQGVPFNQEEKEILSKMDDDDMIEGIVQKMPEDCRKTFGHFILQLQLVMSAVSRVRSVLEDGLPEEMAQVMEDGDHGVTSQILQQTVVEAATQVGEIREMHESWQESMSRRFARLMCAQQEFDHAQNELERTTIKLNGFGSEQNSKAKSVLLSIAGKNEKALLRSVYSHWVVHFRSFAAERKTREKFRREIEAAQRKLAECRQAQVANVWGVLRRTAGCSDKALLAESMRAWARHTEEVREDKKLEGQFAMAREKMGALRHVQKENARKTMQRICQGNDESFLSLCMQEWIALHRAEMKDQAVKQQVKAAEAKIQAFLRSKSEQARDVLNRMAVSNDTGLLHSAFAAWSEELESARKARAMEDVITHENAKFAKLNARMKEGAYCAAARAAELERENLAMQCFMNWAMEANLGRMIRHYSGQMDSKKQQLQAVHGLFKDFATQLEEGLGSTPRTTRKSHRERGSSRVQKEKSPDKQSRPPFYPAPAAA